MILENFRKKIAVGAPPISNPPSSPPPLSRASSYSSESNADLEHEVIVCPLTLPKHDSHPLVRQPEQSLRQRSTLSLLTPSAPAATAASSTNDLHQDTESLAGSEDGSESGDKLDKTPNSASALLGSVLGLASNSRTASFLLGPHIFSTSELKPPRSRKASRDFAEEDTSSSPAPIDDDTGSSALSSLGLGKTPSKSSSNNLLYRRVQSQFSSNLSGASSSFSDVDLENAELNDDVVPLMSSSYKLFSPRRRPQASNASNNNKNNNSARNSSNSLGTTAVTATASNNSNYAFTLRSREQIIIHILMELRMAYVDIVFLAFATFYQFFHSAVTNVAYYQHAQLSAANRVPLKDIAFEWLPSLDGELWIISEYFLFGIISISLFCVISNVILSWNAPHGRPIYSMQIVRRMGMTWIVCQTLRMISFLITTLPGASRQCRYSLPEGLTREEMVGMPAPDEGNPVGWAPPTSLKDILFRVDATNGCGDLMFSSHTIFTMTFVCVVFKYFNFKWLKAIMAVLQIAIVPFILAARKHYSVDVFTALYVTPLVFEILWIRLPDRDTTVDLAKHYGIRFYLAQDEEDDAFTYVVSVWGREYYVDPEQLPVDLKEQGNCLMKKLAPSSWGKGMESSSSVASIV
mmetsp:Transcript_6260/g.13533  ORF Transcript_6260/g.13533 Transcript_6260/m.13533 type:complete len:634 (+) Transcript_6260:238-2139(+)